MAKQFLYTIQSLSLVQTKYFHIFFCIIARLFNQKSSPPRRGSDFQRDSIAYRAPFGKLRLRFGISSVYLFRFPLLRGLRSLLPKRSSISYVCLRSLECFVTNIHFHISITLFSHRLSELNDIFFLNDLYVGDSRLHYQEMHFSPANTYSKLQFGKIV